MKNINLIEAIVALVKAVSLLTANIAILILTIEKIPARLHSEWVDSTEVCKILNIQPNTLYKHVKKYNIPTRKVGKKSYYRLKDIERLLVE